MTTSPDPHPVARLTLGHGATELEIFLEPTCPYSKRTFEKLPAFLALVGEDKLTVKIRFNSQPWHLFSGIVTRAVLAASAKGGKEAGLRAMAGIYAKREAFEFENHSSGPNMDRTPSDILRDIGAIVGFDLFEPFTWKSVDRALRWHVKYGRQNGVHQSPTFAIDRIVEPSMSSGQTVEEWAELLRPHVEANAAQGA